MPSPGWITLMLHRVKNGQGLSWWCDCMTLKPCFCNVYSVDSTVSCFKLRVSVIHACTHGCIRTQRVCHGDTSLIALPQELEKQASRKLHINAKETMRIAREAVHASVCAVSVHVCWY